MALLPFFDPPALLRDAPAGSSFYRRWSEVVSGLTGSMKQADGGGAYYNPLRTNVDPLCEKRMTWMGFPRTVLLSAGNRDDRRKALLEAEGDLLKRAPQNEYFEWRADRDKTGKITRVTFVTEMPEYYELLWETDRQVVVQLYRTLVSPAVKEADLHKGGKYNPFNRWNTTDGIMHYIQQANSLLAAIDLARRATRSPKPFRDNYEARPALAAQTTSADPRICYDLHMMMRKGLYVTLRNPVALYIAGWDGSGITRPDGRPAGDYWRIVRGVPGMVLRLEYEVPAGAGFVVGDLRIGGHPIEFGGQLAEHITVSLNSIAGHKASKA